MNFCGSLFVYLIRNCPIKPLKAFACPDNFFDILAFSAAAMEFACTTLDISLIPLSMEATISDCRTLARAISSISILID